MKYDLKRQYDNYNAASVVTNFCICYFCNLHLDKFHADQSNHKIKVNTQLKIIVMRKCNIPFTVYFLTYPIKIPSSI